MSLADRATRWINVTLAASFTAMLAVLVAEWQRHDAHHSQNAIRVFFPWPAILVLLILCFDVLPALRRRRERQAQRALLRSPSNSSGYFQTSPRETDPYGLFAHGYEDFVAWARTPAAPVLHLSGPSGVGKTSLISAYLKPRLAEPFNGITTTVITIRSYADFELSFKEALLPLFQENVPPDFDRLSPAQSLEKVVDAIGDDQRLLVVFDRLEECFSPLPQDSTTALPASPVKDSSHSARTGFEALRALLQLVASANPKQVCLLLSYREECHGLLSDLGLPPRHEGVNWLALAPFSIEQARRFLDSCPGLTLPPARIHRALVEAAKQDDGTLTVRPIVANLLGMLLEDNTLTGAFWARSGGVLDHHIRAILGDELAKERADVLRAVLDATRAGGSASAQDIAKQTRMPERLVTAHLNHFGRTGVVRTIPSTRNDASFPDWQFVHPFVATLVARVIDNLQVSKWRVIRPWIAPVAALPLMVGMSIPLLPTVQKQLAINHLVGMGFAWNENSGELIGTGGQVDLPRPEPIANSLRHLRPRSIKFPFCTDVSNLEGLSHIGSLRLLEVRHCQLLRDVRPFHHLPELVLLDLSNSPALESLTGIGNLTSLQILHLSDCTALKSLRGLEELPQLISLSLTGCTALRDAGTLHQLRSLRYLDLARCDRLPKGSWPDIIASLPYTSIRLPDETLAGPPSMYSPLPPRSILPPK